MSKARKRPTTRRKPTITMCDREIDEMIETAIAFGLAATHLRDLEVSPSTPDGYGIFKATCVNAGYAMELLLKVLCHIHNGNFDKTHDLISLHDALPESVKTGLDTTFWGNVEKFGIEIRWMMDPSEEVHHGTVPFSFSGYLREFDRVGMASHRYPTTLNRSREPMPNHVHQALLGAITLNAAVRHYANRP